MTAAALVTAAFVVAPAAIQAQEAYVGHTIGGSLYSPYGAALDSSGNFYFADQLSQTILQVPPGCVSAACVVTMGGTSSVFQPSGVAVDSSGNVYVADTGDTVVKEIPAGCHADGCVLTLGDPSVLYPALYGIAVDKSGNVYFGDVNLHTVYEMTPGCVSSGCTTPLGFGVNGFGQPQGLAVDPSGNVYVADAEGSAGFPFPSVFVMTPNCLTAACVSTLGGGFAEPTGVAVDATGNIWVSDYNGEIFEMAPGCASSLCAIGVGGGYASPWGVAVDSNGNVYTSDYLASAVREVVLHATDLGQVAVVAPTPGTATVTFTFTQNNVTVGSVSVLSQGTGGQEFTDAGTGSCTKGAPTASYSVDDTCTVDVIFNPQYASVRSGAVVLEDASNNVIATGYLTGTGTGPQVIFSSNNTLNSLNSGFVEPNGVALDAAGNVFDADNNLGGGAVKEILAASGYTTVNTLGGGFKEPAGVAVDGAGNVFVADTGNNAVKEILAASGYAIVNTIGSGFSFPTGVAVDAAGNVFVADSGNNAVKEIVAAGGYFTVDTLGSGFNQPGGVALDGAGNVFVADTENHEVKEILAAGGYTTVNLLYLNYYSSPAALALDAQGNIFVSDAVNNTVQEILAAGNYTKVNTLGSGYNQPSGVALDSKGNVFVADLKNFVVKELDFSDPPEPLTFATTPAGQTSTDSPQTVSIYNLGNQDLLIDEITYGTDFPEQPGVFTDCPESGALTSGSSCTLSINFSPLLSSANGLSTPLNESVILQDNNLNNPSAVQMVGVLGTETTTPPSITSPSAGTTLGGGTTFTWNQGTGADAFQIYVGSTGAGSSNLYKGPDLGSAATSSASINIPANGAAVNVRLWYLLNGSWMFQDYTYNEAAPPSITSPLAGTLLGGNTVFTWNPGTGASEYQVYVGTTGAGSKDLSWGADLPNTTTSSASVNIPINAAAVYVRLWYLVNGNWLFQDYTYTEATAPSITSPSISTLLGGQTIFTLNPGSGADQIQLYIGDTAPGSNDVYWGVDVAGSTTSIGPIVIPVKGGTLYARLWYEKNGSWQHQDYTYAEATPPSISTPTPGVSLGSPTTFTWSQGSGADSFQIYAGTTGPGSSDVYRGPDLPGTATSSAPIKIPNNGATLNVRLWFLKNNSWQFVDYVYAENM